MLGWRRGTGLRGSKGLSVRDLRSEERHYSRGGNFDLGIGWSLARRKTARLSICRYNAENRDAHRSPRTTVAISIHRFVEISIGIATGLVLTSVWPAGRCVEEYDYNT
jgi:hypothetical protein